MKSLEPKSDCPRCGKAKMKAWEDLTGEQKFLAEKLPLSAEYSLKTRKKHRFCARCWYEETEPKNERA